MHDRIEQDGVRFNVTNVLLHPEFEPLADYDVVDVAVLILDRKIEFSDTVRPVCLPANVRQSYDGRRAMVAGWGRMSEGGANSKRLQTTRVMMMSGAQCALTQLSYLLQQDKMMCGYARRADACQGDSGGPLVVNTAYNRFEQIGECFMYMQLFWLKPKTCKRVIACTIYDVWKQKTDFSHT